MATVDSNVRTRWAPVIALGLAMLVVTAEMTMAAVTLPGIGADLGVGPAATAWVLLGYSLPMAAIAVPAGRWADGAGVRAAFLLSMTGVGLASLLTAIAPSFWLLIVGRVLQGMSAALIVAVYMPIVTGSVAVEQRGRAMGYIVTIMTVGGMVGVPLGGLVAGALSWREVFLLKIPLLLVVLWLARRSVPDNGNGLPLPNRPLIAEALLLGGGVAAVLLCVDQAAANPVPAAALALLGLGLGAWWVRLPASRPVLTLIRDPTFGSTLLALLAMSFTIGLIAFLMPYLIADVLHGSAGMTGFVLLFFVGAMALVSSLAGVLADRYGPRVVALVGAVVSVAGMLTMLGLGPQAGTFDLAWRLALLGVGAGLFNTPVNAAVLAATPEGMTGTAGGLAMTVRTVAATIGPVLAALCWTVAGGGIAGFRTGVTVLSGFAVLALLILLRAAGREVGRARSGAPTTNG